MHKLIFLEACIGTDARRLMVQTIQALIANDISVSYFEPPDVLTDQGLDAYSDSLIRLGCKPYSDDETDICLVHRGIIAPETLKPEADGYTYLVALPGSTLGTTITRYSEALRYNMAVILPRCGFKTLESYKNACSRTYSVPFDSEYPPQTLLDVLNLKLAAWGIPEMNLNIDIRYPVLTETKVKDNEIIDETIAPEITIDEENVPPDIPQHIRDERLLNRPPIVMTQEQYIAGLKEKEKKSRKDRDSVTNLCVQIGRNVKECFSSLFNDDAKPDEHKHKVLSLMYEARQSIKQYLDSPDNVILTQAEKEWFSYSVSDEETDRKKIFGRLGIFVTSPLHAKGCTHVTMILASVFSPADVCICHKDGIRYPVTGSNVVEYTDADYTMLQPAKITIYDRGPYASLSMADRSELNRSAIKIIVSGTRTDDIHELARLIRSIRDAKKWIYVFNLPSSREAKKDIRTLMRGYRFIFIPQTDYYDVPDRLSRKILNLIKKNA